MGNARIDGKRGYIAIVDDEIIIQKGRLNLSGDADTVSMKITKQTQILGKFARLTDGFVAIMDKYPSMDERKRHHPSMDPKTIILPEGFPAEKLVEFMQAFWSIRGAIPKPVGVTSVVSTTPKRKGPPTGSNWYVDYSSGYLKEYVVIDLETTGLSPYNDKIIEVGAVRYIDDVEIARFSSLVRPYTNSLLEEYSIDEFEAMGGTAGIEYIEDPFITNLTGITNEMLEDAPTARQVGPQLFDFIGNLPVVGHNIARFDLIFLRKLASETKTRTTIGHDYIDTMHMVPDYASGAPSKKLSDVGFHLGVYGYLDNHRALDDAIYNAKVFQEMKKKASVEELEDYRVYDNRSLTAFAIQPNPEIFRLGGPLFGKHFVFTGEMAVRRAEAMQRVSDLGGIPLQGVTKKANYLVISERDDSQPVAKLQRAREYIHLGQELEIIYESDFYKMLAHAKS